MVIIVEQIPKKTARMVKVLSEKPVIEGIPGYETITYDDFSIPRSLNGEFLRKCKIGIKHDTNGLSQEEVLDRIQQATADKNVYLRFADKKPLSVVTDRFKEISPDALVEKTTKIMGVDPTVRYFRNNETLQLNFPVDTRFPGMNLVVSTGEYGTFGGSGKHAISYGVSWFNNICTNWTIFLDRSLNKSFGRIRHMGGNGYDADLEKLMGVTDELGGIIDDSRAKPFTYAELDGYFNQYERKGLNKKITKQIREENPNGMSAYDLSYRLTELCQNDKLSDTSRAKIEYLAGEVILCYDNIMNGIVTPKPERRLVLRPAKKLEKVYVGLN